MITKKLAVDMTVYGKELKKDFEITVGKPYKIYGRGEFLFINGDDGNSIALLEEIFDTYFTTEQPHQELEREESKLNIVRRIEIHIETTEESVENSNTPDYVKELLDADNKLLNECATEITQLQSRVKEFEQLLNLANEAFMIMRTEYKWQTDVAVPDLEKQITSLREQIEKLSNNRVFFADYIQTCCIKEGIMTYPLLKEAVKVWDETFSEATKLATDTTNNESQTPTDNN